MYVPQGRLQLRSGLPAKDRLKDHAAGDLAHGLIERKPFAEGPLADGVERRLPHGGEKGSHPLPLERRQQHAPLAIVRLIVEH